MSDSQHPRPRQVTPLAHESGLDCDEIEAEVNALSANFHEKSNAEIMREVVNSADFQAALSHRDYLELLFRVCLVTLNFSQTLFTTTLAELESGAITRWDACLRVIDSSSPSAGRRG